MKEFNFPKLVSGLQFENNLPKCCLILQKFKFTIGILDDHATGFRCWSSAGLIRSKDTELHLVALREVSDLVGGTLNQVLGDGLPLGAVA